MERGPGITPEELQRAAGWEGAVELDAHAEPQKTNTILACWSSFPPLSARDVTLPSGRILLLPDMSLSPAGIGCLSEIPIAQVHQRIHFGYR